MPTDPSSTVLLYNDSYMALKPLKETEKCTIFKFLNPEVCARVIAGKKVEPLEGEPLFLNLVCSLYNICLELNSTKPTVGAAEKNLIYFTIGYSKEYLDLIKCCIYSIVSNSKDLSNVDFLLITDSKQAFDEVAKAFPDLNLDYLVVPSAEDGIQASMNKLKVFEYEHIFKYKKILFLDADIVFNNDANQIFDLDIEDHKIYSIIQEGCDYETHNSRYHNITEYTKEKIERLEKLKIKPFNAGQFLMVSSVAMARHFTNVNFISHLWQKEYFFEQSFLNTYFNYNEASNTSLLEDHFLIYYIEQHTIENLKLNKSKNVHYAGDPCNGSTKLEFLKSQFPNYYDILT